MVPSDRLTAVGETIDADGDLVTGLGLVHAD